jgi:hypothetical protein
MALFHLAQELPSKTHKSGDDIAVQVSSYWMTLFYLAQELPSKTRNRRDDITEENTWKTT